MQNTPQTNRVRTVQRNRQHTIAYICDWRLDAVAGCLLGSLPASSRNNKDSDVRGTRTALQDRQPRQHVDGHGTAEQY